MNDQSTVVVPASQETQTEVVQQERKVMRTVVNRVVKAIQTDHEPSTTELRIMAPIFLGATAVIGAAAIAESPHIVHVALGTALPIVGVVAAKMLKAAAILHKKA